MQCLCVCVSPFSILRKFHLKPLNYDTFSDKQVILCCGDVLFLLWWVMSSSWWLEKVLCFRLCWEEVRFVKDVIPVSSRWSGNRNHVSLHQVKTLGQASLLHRKPKQKEIPILLWHTEMVKSKQWCHVLKTFHYKSFLPTLTSSRYILWTKCT